MVSNISQQTTALTVPSGTEALSRNAQSSQNVADSQPEATSTPQKKLDASYEVNLSDAAQNKVASSALETNSPENAQKQLALIKSALEKSTTNLASLHRTSPQSVIDLLA